MTNRQRILALLLIVALFAAPSVIGYVSARLTHYKVIDVAGAGGTYHGGPGRFWFVGKSIHVASDNGQTRDFSDKDYDEITIEQ